MQRVSEMRSNILGNIWTRANRGFVFAEDATYVGLFVSP